MLNAREERFLFEKNLEQKFEKPIIVCAANCPGSDKRNFYSTYAVYCLYTKLIERVSPVFTHFSHTKEGFVVHMVADLSADRLKLICIELEETHPLGRLVDLDVFCGGENLSRRALGRPARSCFLCERPAIECVRSERHEKSLLTGHFERLVLNYIAELPAVRLAEFGLINEVVRDRGYGCVTVHSNGSHSDMSFETFLTSIAAISHAVGREDFARIKSFSELREAGVRIESEMFAATGGINTHKGFIFSYLFLIHAFFHVAEFRQVPEHIRRMAKTVYEDFEKDLSTKGAQLYKSHKIKGVRALAHGGYSQVFCDFLPFLKREGPDRLALLLISRTEDTAVISRSSYEDWETLRRLAELALASGDTAETERFIAERNISTGGSADVYALTLAAFITEKLFYIKGAEQVD